MFLNYTLSGFLYISPEDDCKAIVDAMLATDYNEEYCIALDFSPEFVRRLMEAGFLVMAVNVTEPPQNPPADSPNGEVSQDDDSLQQEVLLDIPESSEEPASILLPKLHVVRSALFFNNLHIKKSIRRFLNLAVSGYALRPNSDFDLIVDRCIEKHGAGWLIPQLIECIKKIRQNAGSGEEGQLLPAKNAWPSSFALYRGGKLVAGEFGVVCGNVYTSYSGFYDEDNAGTVQIILAARYLQEHGFRFFDLGMPLDYKKDFGAVDISPREFVRLFRGEM